MQKKKKHLDLSVEPIGASESEWSKKYESFECENEQGVKYHVFCYLLTDPEELACRKGNDGIRKALAIKNLSSEGGVYFYRFANDNERPKKRS